MRKLYNQALKRGPFIKEITLTNISKVLQLKFGILKQEGRIYGISVFGEDITESRKAIENARLSEERFKHILESAPEGVTVIIHSKLVYANRCFADMVGYTVVELLKKDILEVTDEKYKDLIRKKTSTYVTSDNIPDTFEMELIRSDNSLFSVECTVSGIDYNGEKGVLVFIRDITTKKENEEIQSRLEALYRHAHELNELEKIEDLSDVTLKIMQNLLNCKYVSIQIVKGDYLQILGTKGAAPLGIPMLINGKGVTTKAARERKSILVRDTRLDPDFVKGSTNTLCELAVPIICGGELLGVLNAESFDANAFCQADQMLMEAFADEIGSTVKRIMKND